MIFGEKEKDRGSVSKDMGVVVVIIVVVAAAAIVAAAAGGGESNVTSGDDRIKDDSKWWSYNKQMINQADKMGVVGLSILGDVGAFYYMGKTKQLLEYESSLPKQFDTDTDTNLHLNLNLNPNKTLNKTMNLKGLCLYHQTDFDRLSEEQKQELVKHHAMAVLLQAH